MSRADVREHNNIIRSAAIKAYFAAGLNREQVAVTLGIEPNEVAIYERLIR